jgi:hypothetical protein
VTYNHPLLQYPVFFSPTMISVIICFLIFALFSGLGPSASDFALESYAVFTMQMQFAHFVPAGGDRAGLADTDRSLPFTDAVDLMSCALGVAIVV